MVLCVLGLDTANNQSVNVGVYQTALDSGNSAGQFNVEG
jgi:hypothetical protein